MGIGPRQDLTDSQAGQAGLVPHAATPGEQLGQGSTALQAAVSLTQGIVDRPPGFARSPVNLSPDRCWGHCPVRAWCSSAQARI